jgi:hypothetical protein
MDQPTDPTTVPSASTGVYDLPEDRRDRILAYGRALFEAKAAGVAGAGIENAQRFLDHVIRQRVVDALDDDRWAARVQEMDTDTAGWQRRIADRAPRALRRIAEPSTTSAAAVHIIRRGMTLPTEQRRALADRYDEVVDRDIERAAELLPSVVQPHMASLQWRSADFLKKVPHMQEFRKVAMGHPAAIQAAAAATFAGDRLPPPIRAALLGPWAEVVDYDPSILEGAWTAEADDLRADFTTIDPWAWDEADEAF